MWDEGRNDGQYIQSEGSGLSVHTSGTLENRLFELRVWVHTLHFTAHLTHRSSFSSTNSLPPTSA